MAALTGERATVQVSSTYDGVAEYPVKTGVTIYKGAAVCVDSTGYAVPAGTAGLTNLSSVGVAQNTVVAGAAASGTYTVATRLGVFRFNNSAGDAIAITDVGKRCFFADDQTVAKTGDSLANSITNPRPVAGIVEGYSAAGVDVLISATDRSAPLISTTAGSYTSNNWNVTPVCGAHYDVPTSGAASTITLGTTGVARGTWCVFTADGVKNNGDTVTFMQSSTAISAATTVSKAFAAMCVFDGTDWHVLLTVAPNP